MMKKRILMIVIVRVGILMALLSCKAIAQLPNVIKVKTLKTIGVHHAIRHENISDLAKGLEFQQLLDTITSKGLNVSIFHTQFRNGDSVTKGWLNIYIMRIFQSSKDTAYYFAKSQWPGDTLFFSNEFLKDDTLKVQKSKKGLYRYEQQYKIALNGVGATCITSDRVDHYGGDPNRQNKRINFETSRVKRTIYGGSNACKCDYVVISSLMDEYGHYRSFNSQRFIISGKGAWEADSNDLSFMISSKRSENSLHFRIKVFDDFKNFDKDITKSDHINLIFLYYPTSFFGEYDSSSYDKASVFTINPYNKQCEIKGKMIDSINIQFEEFDGGYIVSLSATFSTLRKQDIRISNRDNECLGFTCEVFDYDQGDSNPTIMATSNFRAHPNCIGQLTFLDFFKDSWCPFTKLEINE